MLKNKSTFCIIYALAFAATIANAITGYVQSSYLNHFLSLNYIGLFLSLVTIITIIISFIYPKLISRHSVYSLTILTLFLSIIASLFMSSGTNSLLILIAFTIRYLSLTFLMINLDIFLEDISTDNRTGVIRTQYLTVMNVAWLMSPLLMGHIIGPNNDYPQIYYIGGLILLAAFILLIFTKHQLPRFKIYRQEQSLSKGLNKLIGHGDRRRIFFSSLVLQFFYALMTLYVPIYLNQDVGLSWTTLSIIFTIMLIPFVVLELPAGALADKLLGEKEILLVGNIIMIISVVGIFLAKTANPFVWGFLLFCSRVGAALAESMQESYFYKKIDSHDTAVINLYRQNRSLGWLLASLTAFITLSFCSLPAIFIVLAISLTLGLIPILGIHDTR
jgi:MFS family permease